MTAHPELGSSDSAPPHHAAAAHSDAVSSCRSPRPWGWFETLARGEGYLVKRLLIQAGRRISLQRHQHRCEHWVVVAGDGQFELEGASIAAEVGTSLFVPQGAWHRAAAGAADLLIIEVQRGLDLREDDIERRADDFGRLGPETASPTPG